MARSFVAAPINEIRLEASLRRQLQVMNLSELEDSLPQLTEEQGIEYATAAAKIAIEEDPVNKPFLESLRSETLDIGDLQLDAEVVVLPGLLYELVPEAGIDGRVVSDVAESLGVKCHFAATRSQATTAENIEVLENLFSSIQSRRIIVVSVSKGIFNLRHWLSESQNSEVKNRIAAVFSVCGTPFGSKLVDTMYRNWRRRMSTFFLTRFIKIPYRNFKGYAFDEKAKQFDWRTGCPDRLLVSAPAVPMPFHIRRPLVGRYKALRKEGPNDGVVHLTDSIIPGSYVAPIYGADHFLRSTEVTRHLYRFFRYCDRHFNR